MDTYFSVSVGAVVKQSSWARLPAQRNHPDRQGFEFMPGQAVGGTEHIFALIPASGWSWYPNIPPYECYGHSTAVLNSSAGQGQLVLIASTSPQ